MASTSRPRATAKVHSAAAEDYVHKPYHYPEPRARIARVLRRLGDKVPRRPLRERCRFVDPKAR